MLLPILVFSAVSAARAEPEAAAAPFTWTVRVGGAAQTMAASVHPVETGLVGWRCEARLDPVEETTGARAQFGVLRCVRQTGDDAPRRRRSPPTDPTATVETTVLCRTTAQRPADSGSASLVLEQGAATVGVELGCATPDAAPRARLQLSPDSPPGSAPGMPEIRTPPTPGTYRWRLSGPPGGSELTRPGQVASGVAGWTCAQAVSGVVDPIYGYAEYGTFSCEQGDLRATVLVPCVRTAEGEATCQAGSLTVRSGGATAGWMLACETVGNPGCF